MEIHQYINHHDEYDVVAVDEAFMIPGASWVLIDLFKKGKTIVVSSLDLSATGKAFDEVEAMFPWATHIEKCPPFARSVATMHTTRTKSRTHC